jgi:hypothetical protein
MQSLTPEEYQLVANLAGDRGFIILLDALQADMDDLADEIHSAESDEAERRAVSRWRSFRELVSRMQEITNFAAVRLQSIGDERHPTEVAEDTTLTSEESQTIWDIMGDKSSVTNQDPMSML